MRRYVVLDTNCLLQSLSHRSPFYTAWESFLNGKYVLCITNDILEEYEEIITSHISNRLAKYVIETILRSNNVLRVDAQFRFGLIVTDPDDNKFVDCAIVANADYIVSEDSHFNVLRSIKFPRVEVIHLRQFCEELCQ